MHFLISPKSNIGILEVTRLGRFFHNESEQYMFSSEQYAISQTRKNSLSRHLKFFSLSRNAHLRVHILVSLVIKFLNSGRISESQMLFLNVSFQFLKTVSTKLKAGDSSKRKKKDETLIYLIENRILKQEQQYLNRQL